MDPSSSSSSYHHSPPPTAFKNPSTFPKRNSDFFRSRLPSDPFFSNSAFRERAPIVINSERLYRAASNSHPTRHVILVLGDPSAEDLAPLLDSERLAFSLLIIASHQPPSIPSKVQPAIRILRLVDPLALEQLGAVRLVNVLEWAERVARTWRKVGGIGVEELSECDQEEGFGSLPPPPRVHRLRTKSHSSSLISHPDSTSSSAPSISSFDKLFSRVKRRYRAERGPPPVDPSQRPFDALVNYLPSNIPDKALLKHAILVTTVSRPFLVAAAPPSARPQGTPRRRMSIYSMLPTPFGSEDSIDSLFTGSTLPNTPPSKAHLVHLLPHRPRNSVANRLLDSIETFLISFSFPPSLEKRDASSTIEPARACLLESTAFAEPVGTPPSLSVSWTVADILLSGCLDDDPMPRAWLSGASDIVVSALPPSPPSLTPPPAAHLNRLTPSSSATTPGSSRPSSNSPSPPDSEEGTSYRRASPVKKKLEKLSWRWRLWKRSSTALPSSR